MTARVYLNILKTGVFLAFGSFLLVFAQLLFPYITSKQLSFNILIEILLIPLLVLWIKYPSYRPQKSYLTGGLLAYFIVIFLSCVLGVDFNLSFWSNAERMLGFFHLSHFFFFYLIIITAFRSEKDWRWVFNISLLVAVIITIYGLATKYPASTIGNTAYVAGLMIFNFFFALWSFFKTKNWAARLLYLWALIFVLIGFVNANISGAQAGLAVGLLVFGLVLVFLGQNRKIKIWGGVGLAIFVVIIGLLFVFRAQPMFDNTRLGQMLRDFSKDNITLNTRLISWRAAALDFTSHPIFGTGYGNYAIIFDKHFDPKFYDYTRSETYFDRAHNNLIDIASTTGILGLLSYLSIFVAVGYYLRRAYLDKRVSLWELSILVGLLAAYFVQNLAVFDSLVTYVSLFVTLGFIYYRTHTNSSTNLVADVQPEFTVKKEYACLLGIAVVLIFFAYQFNIRGFLMLSQTIQGYSYVSRGYISDGLDLYRQAFANYNVGYNRDSRSSLINLIVSNAQALRNLPADERQEVLDYLISLAKENISYNPYDSVLHMQLAQIANTAARYSYEDLDKFNEYSALAVNAIEYSIEASPGRVPLYAIKADIYLTRGDQVEALAAIKKAIEIKPNYGDSYCQLANVSYFYKDFNTAYEAAGQCTRYGGLRFLQPNELIQKAANYLLKNNQEDLGVAMQDYLLELEGSDGQ